jgi:hypothetical protein
MGGQGSGRPSVGTRRLHKKSPVWITFGHCDGHTGPDFFLRTTGGRHSSRQARCRGGAPGNIHSVIPMLRTVMAACLHRLSTGLCTAGLDVREHEGKTVRAIR